MAVETSAVVPVKVRRPAAESSLWNLLPFIIFVLVCAFLPRFTSETGLMLLIYIGISALLAIGLNLLMGYAGQISLGHAAFFGIGAYTSAILTVRPISSEVIPGFSAGVGIIAGVAALMSIARVTGGRLALGAVALVLLGWVAALSRSHFVATLLIYGVGMALFGIAMRIKWWRAGAAGIICALSAAVCDRFLLGVLSKGGASPWTAMLVGIIFTSLIAYLIGGQVLRLKGHYLAMATLGFGVIVEIIFRQWTAVTGGSSDGIFGIPSIAWLDGSPGFVRNIFALLAGGQVDLQKQYYYLVWGFVFIALVLAVNIVRSRVGRAFRAVHSSEVAAESLGVDTQRYKIQVFVLSAAMASVAGSLHAHNAGVGYVNPGDFGFAVSVQLLVMVVVGGMASVWGALFGASVIQLLKNWMLNLDKADVSIMGLTLKGLDPIVFGAVLIMVMVMLPQGFVRGITDMAAAAWRTARRGRAK
ncbi:branched-chain amino acid ABC transporter permease [bacterium]|nr:branched-chain amino acid ABC transporter permease [bacterium]